MWKANHDQFKVFVIYFSLYLSSLSCHQKETGKLLAEENSFAFTFNESQTTLTIDGGGFNQEVVDLRTISLVEAQPFPNLAGLVGDERQGPQSAAQLATIDDESFYIRAEGRELSNPRFVDYSLKEGWNKPYFTEATQGILFVFEEGPADQRRRKLLKIFKKCPQGCSETLKEELLTARVVEHIDPRSRVAAFAIDDGQGINSRYAVKEFAEGDTLKHLIEEANDLFVDLIENQAKSLKEASEIVVNDPKGKRVRGALDRSRQFIESLSTQKFYIKDMNPANLMFHFSDEAEIIGDLSKIKLQVIDGDFVEYNPERPELDFLDRNTRSVLDKLNESRFITLFKRVLFNHGKNTPILHPDFYRTLRQDMIIPAFRDLYCK